MNTNHSPLPWTNNVDTIWRGSKPIVILPVNDPVSIADAAYIVQACNAFPALVEALEACEKAMGKHPAFNVSNARLEARAALALARGGVVDGQGGGVAGGEKGGEVK